MNLKNISVFISGFSSPDHVRVTDEGWIAKTWKYGPFLILNVISALEESF